MVRIVKEEQYAARRDEILTAAQRLVETKGYRQMTIQDILEDLQISKGAFYHYFRSKHALLDAIIERMQGEVEQLATPIVQDPHLPALEKLQRLFTMLARWKTAQKEFFLALLNVWYMEDNALVRQKTFTTSVEKVAPMLTEIIHQGIREGALKTSYPDQAGEIVLYILQGVNETFARLLLSAEPSRDNLKGLEKTVAAYSDALERVLGAVPGSIHLVDVHTLQEWLTPQSQIA